MSKGSNNSSLTLLEALITRFEASNLTHLEFSDNDVKVALHKDTAPSNTQKEIPSGQIVASPLVGTFCACALQNTTPFVSVGDYISKGQVIGLIETMKVYNEVTSDFEGKVSKIFVTDQEPVGFEQPLLLIE